MLIQHLQPSDDQSLLPAKKKEGHNDKARNPDLFLRITQSKQVTTILKNSEISASFVYNPHDAMTKLASTPPAFLWLDIDRENAEAFLREVVDWVLRPPYIILTSSFINSQDRAIMLDHGADTCIEMPADPVEIVSVVNAVLRRGEQTNGPFTNLLPCNIIQRFVYRSLES